jgi:hypothetical protein
MWNMPYKARTESDELKILRILVARIELSEDKYNYYLGLEKGFAGEVQFDLLTEKLQPECYILNDLLLESNNTLFQIDTTIISQEALYLSEVKNMEGEYCYDDDSFNTNSGKAIKNPLDQIKRSNSLLRQLIRDLGYKLPIVANVIFINPEFTLYQAPKDLPFVLPTQLNRFMKKLNNQHSKLSEVHKNLAEQLVSLHISKSPYSQIPPFEYEQLKKGITCSKCRTFSLNVLNYSVICRYCGCIESVPSAVIRSVEEYKLLFPERKITTNDIHEWCGIIESKRKIRRILGNNYTIIGEHQWSYYEYK